MSIARHHAEWLSLVEVSGPFLSMPVLMRVFTQGLEAHDPETFRLLRMAYGEWEDNIQAGHRTNPAIHANWIKFVLRTMLQLPDNCIAEGQGIPQSLQVNVAEHGELLRPSIVIKNPDGGPNGGKPRLLIQTYPANQDLSKPVHGFTWKASPDTRMMELLHGTGVRLGLVTNGEQWMLVDAPRNETTGFASWYANLWLEEQITLRAFNTLLNANRFFAVPDSDMLEALLAESASNQQEVTDQLGYQVRKAVEVLVQSLDRADQDHGRQLLCGVPEAELYEAALTIMMRLVFLFCAEERGLLLLGDAVYDENYAVSTMHQQLHEAADQHGEEILERRHDAWCRLLSTFRGIFGGIEHERMNLPPYGGKLFDPDRFPFLEGRKHGTTWKSCPAEPLPINNRTILHLLDALQLLQVKVPGGRPSEARRLSFRALDIEQIGHVYEGLLDHTAKRATEHVVGLTGAKDREPELPLSKLEELKANGDDALVAFLVEKTGRSEKTLRKAIQADFDQHEASRFQSVCGGDTGLLNRITPFAGLIRDDTFGYPVAIPSGSVYVTTGTNRRSSGTHYTPRILTEPLTRYTLEPLIYVGPAEGKPKEEWKLRPVKELLDLKICDMACGSGSILLQAGRYMAERLMEAWEIAEKSLPSGTPGITPDGAASTGTPGETLIPKDPDERTAYARRLVAHQCLYGVDINPLAVEMCKLSLWLWTIAKDKPFTFLDHAIRSGDSLLGIHDLKQLKTFSLDGTGQQYVFGEEPMDELVDKAVELRLQIESMPNNTVEEVEAQGGLMAECEERLELLRCAADMLIAAELKGGSQREKLSHRDQAAIQIGHFLKQGVPRQLRAAARKEIGRSSFHWPLEYPEIIAKRGGFDGIVGNPPYRHGSRISTDHGTEYLAWLLSANHGVKGTVDLVVYFIRRCLCLTNSVGLFGLITTKSVTEGDNKLDGLGYVLSSGATITFANGARTWPGTANVRIALFTIIKASWFGSIRLDNDEVEFIGSDLIAGSATSLEAIPLKANADLCYKGSELLGDGFLIDADIAARLLADKLYLGVIKPILNGQEFATHPKQQPERFVIDFFDRDEQQAKLYPAAFEIVKQFVKPVRESDNRPARRDRFWRFGEIAKGLYLRLGTCRFALARLFTCEYWFWGQLTPGPVFTNALVVVARDSKTDFAILSSSLHESWAYQQGSSLETRFRYTPSRCFERFPFPECDGSLEAVGDRYINDRATIMAFRAEGFTKIYSRFHDADNSGKDIQKLRDLHVEMDKSVAAAYGWDDLMLGHNFHQTKQGVRFTISDPARHEVLARLLKLNHERYAEEVEKGLHDKTKGKKAEKPKWRLKSDPGPQQTLFALMSYPTTDNDKAICAAFLSAVEQSGKIDSGVSLNTLLLASHPDWCKVFLPATQQRQLISCKARTHSGLFIPKNHSIRWKDARDHLERSNAIAIDRSTPEQGITKGTEFETVKTSLPGPIDEIVAVALMAAKTVSSLSGDGSGTPKQKGLINQFRHEWSNSGISAA